MHLLGCTPADRPEVAAKRGAPSGLEEPPIVHEIPDLLGFFVGCSSVAMSVIFERCAFCGLVSLISSLGGAFWLLHCFEGNIS